MLWLLYADYYKSSIKTNSYIRYLNWYVWVIFSFIMLLTIGLYVAFIFYQVQWLQIIMGISGAVGGLYFGNELRKTVNKHVGTFEDVYDKNIITLRNILENRKVYSSAQIDHLINQINDELPELKVSENILKPYYTISTVLLIPTLTILTKWLLDKQTNGVITVIMITALLVMVFSLFYMLKPLLEQVLDATFWRMKKLQIMLQDIKLIDFLK